MDKICYRNPIEVGCHWPGMKKTNDHAEPTNSNTNYNAKRIFKKIVQYIAARKYRVFNQIALNA